jgi:hypothetical protein
MKSAFLLGAYLSALILPFSGEPVAVEIRPIENFAYFGDRTRFGALEFRGGLVVSSAEKRFGGWSGIHVLEGGSEAIILSDLGYLMRAGLEHDGGRLTGLSILNLMPALPGKRKSIKRNDSEDLAIGADGELVIALEEDRRQIAIRRFVEGGWGKPEFVAVPDARRKLGINKGLESIAVIPPGRPDAGRLLAIAERPPQRSGTEIPCWIIGVGTCAVLKRDRFEITSARFLPGGDLLILERRLAPGFDLAMRLRRIPADRVGAGAVMDGEILMEADLSNQIDNMEGLAIHLDEDGQTIITLVSDDNRNVFQRTLILQFALPSGQRG